MSGDAYHISAPCEDGDGAIRVMRKTLKDAGVEPSAVDYVNVHGTSTPQGDKVEVIAHQARSSASTRGSWPSAPPSR